MKKNIKILIISCVAAVGVGASVGGAYALYKNNSTSPSTFTIGTYTHSTTGEIDYIVKDAVRGSENSTVDPEHTEIYYNFPLGGSYNYTATDELAAAQEVVYGNISVKITADEALFNKVKWYSFVDGYAAGTFWDNWDNNVKRVTPAEDPTITQAVTVLSGDYAVRAVADPVIPETVTSETNQWLRVGFKFIESEMDTPDEFLAIAGKTLSIEVTFGELSANAEAPYIATDTNGYAGDADTQLGFRMMPNIDEETWQWYYKGLSGANSMLIKYHKNDKDYYIKGTDGNDVAIDVAKTYQVYYEGGLPSGEETDHNVLTVNTDTDVIYDVTGSTD